MKESVSLLNSPIRVIEADETFTKALQHMAEEEDRDASFFVMDVGDIIEKVRTWMNKMPRVKIFYAVKCNDHPYVLQLLNKLGAGFDCASKNELDKVLSLGVDPSRIIYANPCKKVSHLKAAKSFGVDLMTFDSKSELKKIKGLFPKARLVLRIRCDAAALFPLGAKFGIFPEESYILLQTAKDLNLNVVGVSFHVGCGCLEPQIFLKAIKLVRDVFETAKEFGFSFHLIDIGGGFLGNTGDSLHEYALYVNKGLREYFPDDSEVSIIGEPGQYIVASAFTLVTKIILKKPSSEALDTPPYSYFINDGWYGSFSGHVAFGTKVHPNVLREVLPDEPFYDCTIWGPTCDAGDVVVELTSLPELDVDDWLFWKDLGAYTLVCASKFNGFEAPMVHMVVPYDTLPYVIKLLDMRSADQTTFSTP